MGGARDGEGQRACGPEGEGGIVTAPSVSQRVQIVLPAEERERLAAYAAAHGLTRSAAVRRLVRECVIPRDSGSRKKDRDRA